MVYRVVVAQLFWNASGLWPLALAVGLGIAALVIWLYPGQTRGLSRRYQIVLPLLRVVAIGALAVSLLQPILVRPKTEQENGVVVVVVDRSASMGVSDSELIPADRVALADGLGAIAADKRLHVLPEAARALQAMRRSMDEITRLSADVEYARLSGRQVKQREGELDAAYVQAKQFAGELSRQLGAVNLEQVLKDKLVVLTEVPSAEQRPAWSRRVGEIIGPAEQVLQKQQAQADLQLYNSDAALRKACDTLASQSRLRLVEEALVNARTGLLQGIAPEVPLFGFALAEDIRPLPLRSGMSSVKRLLLEADGEQTRLGSGLLACMESLKGRSTRAVVLFSDGRACGDSAAPQQLSVANVPVYTIAVGRDNGVRDLAISTVKVPASAYVGETLTMAATVRSMNMPAGDYEVQFAAGETKESKKVHLDSGGSGAVEFQYKAGRAGVETLFLQVKGSDSEVTQKNNSFTRPVRIVQDKVKVLLLTARPSWDFQYVRNALMRTAWANVSDVILEQSNLQFAIDPTRLGEQSVICLFQLPARVFTPQQIDALHQAVTQKGATVIMVAGEAEDLESWSSNVLLSEMLPYRPGGKPVWRSWAGDRAAFRIQPNEGAQRLETLRLADDLETSQARWLTLPGVFHYLAIPQLKPNVIQTLLAEKDSKLPVLVESRLGNGRVLFMGLDETWRWRLRVGERDQDRFWTQLVRYGADEPYALAGEKLSLDVDSAYARPGDTVKVRVRVPGVAGDPPVVEVRQDGKVVQVQQPVTMGDARPGQYQVSLRDLPSGKYEIAARLAGDSAGAASLRLPLEVGYGLQEELADLSADPGALRQMASATGGQMLPIEQIGELPARLRNLQSRSGSMAQMPLWNSAYLFLIVLGCFATEWAIRKRVGLA